MGIFKNMKLRTKLILLFLIIGIVPIAVIGYLDFKRGYDILYRQTIDQLISLEKDRKAQVRDFFKDLRFNIDLLADHRLLKDILADYLRAYKMGGIGGAAYEAVDDRCHGRCVELNRKFGYEDMVFVSNQGDVVITVRKDAVLGTNLTRGPYSNTNLADCFKHAPDEISLVDFEIYPPAGRPAAFIGAPIISRVARPGFEAGEKMGVLIIRIPVDRINTIMQRETGMGETGETYLIGKDMLMRSDLKFLKESPVLKVKTEDAVVREAIQGQSGYKEGVIDYRGHPALVVYGPADIEGLNWAILAKKDLKEIRLPILKLRNQSLTIGFIVALGIVFANFLFVAGIITPLRRMRDAAQKIAADDLTTRLEVETGDEMGMLADSFNRMAESLMKSREKIEGYSHSLEKKVDLRTTALKKKNHHLEENYRTQAAHNEIVTALNSEIEMGPLLNAVIGRIARHTDSQLGMIYLYEECEDDGGTLRPVATYAVDRKPDVAGFRLSQGLPGQAALERKVILVSDAPADYFHISSGSMDGIPKNVICIPITFKDQLMGVLELPSVHSYGNRTLQFLNVVAYQLSLGINNALSYLRIENMASELREKNELLAAQNEELQAQTEELMAQSEELQAQAEELMTQKKALEEKTREVEEADRLKSEFLSNMSHELRTPLNAILGLTNLMYQGSAGPINRKQKEYIEIVERNGKDLLQLINDVLDLSRIESGQIETAVSKIRLKAFIVKVSHNIRPLVEEKGLTLNIDVDDDILIYSDADKLRQILVNLLSNAVKFTSQGGVNISAEVEEGRLRDSIIMRVTDTGTGIPREALKYVFEPFRQVDGSPTREHGGTGLGLSICRKLVSVMGGKIEVESEPGKGSTFTVIIPQDRRNKLRPTDEGWQKKAREAILDKAEVLEKRPLVEDRESRAILVIDDDSIVIRELGIIFKGENYRMTFALTGWEGLQRIRKEVPDLILLDLRMPEMDGFKVLEELQKSKDLKDLPVMIVTAADLTDEEKGRLTENVKGVIRKGEIDKSTLLARINEILYGPGTGRVVEKRKKKAEKRGPVKILIAEDRKDNMILIRETLRSTGYTICAASNGQEALEMAGKERPDLILMDILMPVMSGSEATRRMREIEDLKDIPIIALTARAMKGDEEKALAAGYSDYLSKPVMPKDLIKKVEEWLGKGNI